MTTMTTKQFLSLLVAYFRIEPEDYSENIEILREYLDEEVKPAHREALLKRVFRSCKFFPRLEELSLLYEDVRPPDHAGDPIHFNLAEIETLKKMRQQFIEDARARKPVNLAKWLSYAKREWLLDKYEDLHPDTDPAIPAEAFTSFEHALEVKHL